MKVFCWLGWKQPRIGRAAESRPRRRGRTGDAASAASTPLTRERAPDRLVGERAEHDDHLDARRAARARAPGTAGSGRAPPASACSRAGRTARRRRCRRRASSSPSSARTEVGWFAYPVRCSEREQPVARAVAGEDAAGAVAAVRRGREPGDSTRACGIAEARDRPAPVLLVAERGPLLARDVLAPVDEAGARPALDDLARSARSSAGSIGTRSAIVRAWRLPCRLPCASC